MVSISGRIDGAAHRYPVRIYYEDTDAAGIVYYANYLKFAERARTEMLRLVGYDHSTLAAACHANFAVRRCTVDFRSPARLDDEIEVVTRLRALGGASAELEQTIVRGAEELARIELRLALIATTGRPARLPAPLRAALKPLVKPS